MSVAVKLRVVRNQRDEFVCDARRETVRVGQCVGYQVAVLANGDGAHPTCAQCPLGRRIAREAGVSFGLPATMVVV